MKKPAKRLLGIDYGTKNVGLALTDESATLAFPLVVLSNSSRNRQDTKTGAKNLIQEIIKICREKEVGEIVIGESRDYSGKENPVQKKILELKKELEDATKIPVHLEPEFWTSTQAGKLGGSGNHNDASAAAIILQSWVDRNKKN